MSALWQPQAALGARPILGSSDWVRRKRVAGMLARRSQIAAVTMLAAIGATNF